MAIVELLVGGGLTGVSALGASLLTARGALRATLAQTRATTAAEVLRTERERRRAVYRELISRAHTFSEVTWRIDNVDAAQDREYKDRLLTEIYEHLRLSTGDITRATHEVLLDGPAEVAAAAEQVRAMAMQLRRLLKSLIGNDGTDRRAEYDQSYRDFREAYLTFIDLARQALEVEPDHR